MSPPQSDLFAAATPVLHSLFFALRPDPRQVAGIAERASQLHTAHPGARWVAPSRYHLTLLYLGQSQGRRDDRIQQAIAAAQGLQSAGFSLRLDTLKALGNPANPALALAGEVVPPELQHLWQQLRQRLLRQGVRLAPGEARTLLPHLTLAYTAPRPPLAAIAAESMRFDEFVLLSSVQRQPEYELLGRWPLLPAEPASLLPDEPPAHPVAHGLPLDGKNR
ncbi:RNA 2',3'-cyclic phosphodiesterase [Pseudoxanthomonas dokdonensis]|uniref:RNA 2',3'-cyclic phosphodiesterase n=1 Tax=Pseudoxanthomonas dokdonensis TaxID=344882 RepID=UPI001476CFE6|nr:RNA 2',3'-cyclic phosphodiesterase [Pseudoxanthomonas dokdonensis]